MENWGRHLENLTSAPPEKFSQNATVSNVSFFPCFNLQAYTTMFILTLVAVALVHGRPQTLDTSSTNKVAGGGDALIQQGRNMLANFLVSTQAVTF